jgi:hypothetical protein
VLANVTPAKVQFTYDRTSFAASEKPGIPILTAAFSARICDQGRIVDLGRLLKSDTQEV